MVDRFEGVARLVTALLPENLTISSHIACQLESQLRKATKALGSAKCIIAAVNRKDKAHIVQQNPSI